MVHTGFNWKLCVTIFLLLETVVVGSLKPRVYKKFADTKVEIAAKTFLVAVLVIQRFQLTTRIVKTSQQAVAGPSE